MTALAEAAATKIERFADQVSAEVSPAPFALSSFVLSAICGRASRRKSP